MQVQQTHQSLINTFFNSAIPDLHQSRTPCSVSSPQPTLTWPSSVCPALETTWTFPTPLKPFFAACFKIYPSRPVFLLKFAASLLPLLSKFSNLTISFCVPALLLALSLQCHQIRDWSPTRRHDSWLHFWRPSLQFQVVASWGTKLNCNSHSNLSFFPANFWQFRVIILLHFRRDFYTWLSPRYGNCFTFHSHHDPNNTETDFVINRSGSDAGVSLPSRFIRKAFSSKSTQQRETSISRFSLFQAWLCCSTSSGMST